MDTQKIGHRIKECRKAKKMTQQQLAQIIGKTESSIRKYEKGVIETPLSVLKEIANALDVPYINLISDSDVSIELAEEMIIDKAREHMRELQLQDSFSDTLVATQRELLDKLWFLCLLKNADFKRIDLSDAQVEEIIELVTIAYEIGLKKVGINLD